MHELPNAFARLGIFGAALFTVVLIVASAALGFGIGRRMRQRRSEGEPPVGSIVGATLGLLAFLLAFTFGIAAARHDARRRLVLDEANAIGTATLRASLLSDEAAETVRTRFAEYVDLRLSLARSHDLGRLPELLARTEALQAELWALATSALRAAPDSEAAGLFAAALNDVFDLHTERLAVGARDRIPTPIWAALYLLTAMCMLTVGYHAGMMGSVRFVPLTALVIGFSTVVLLIADLDRPQQGFLRVTQQPLEDLAQALGGERG